MLLKERQSLSHWNLLQPKPSHPAPSLALHRLRGTHRSKGGGGSMGRVKLTWRTHLESLRSAGSATGAPTERGQLWQCVLQGWHKGWG